jgi:hypothetical protein
VTRRVDAVDGMVIRDRGKAVVFLLVLAVVLFILGIFTLKILWWAALILATFWLIGMLRSRNRVHV